MAIRSPERVALFNLGLSLCCLLGLAASAYFLGQEHRATDRLVRHSQDVVAHITELQQLALHAESTGRAYLLVADAALQQRYEDLLPRMDREIAALADLLATDRSEALFVTTIKNRTDARFAFLSKLMQERTAAGVDAVVKAASVGTGRAEMSYVTAALTELKNGQQAQLREYLTQRDRLMQQLWMVTIAFVVAGLALASWGYAETRKADADRRSHERQKEHMARHDPLTGLANRRELQDRLDERIADAARRGSVLALMYIDLDGFKDVNDTFGHDSGDELLMDVARRLRGALRQDDLIARLGGDEFVVVLAPLHSADDIAFVADKLIDVIALPYALESGAAKITASLGVALFPRDGESPKSLLVAADRALYAAKSAGKNRSEWAATALQQSRS